ncbi:Hypothetical Protein FCC1311_076182 [Hondaea fermentalgiana]|uniref:HTH CENPB-type domain-containing protein n=1 Tax=Hondaea fermentalgiana TaxID=2315210 RepID=A0A2R5GU28_9STRA|nr:Hypothetical Protein FCC1311_076182 [Hondaea fermentalgiana]|eukprot:GBG31394.1 Hypothetical Protein FCC1311_076182 [Hondaea fermentalgiana]
MSGQRTLRGFFGVGPTSSEELHEETEEPTAARDIADDEEAENDKNDKDDKNNEDDEEDEDALRMNEPASRTYNVVSNSAYCAQLQRAIDMVLCRGEFAGHAPVSVSEAARVNSRNGIKIARTTLISRLEKARNNDGQCQMAATRLTKHEEERLVRLVLDSARRNLHLDVSMIKQVARDIAAQRKVKFVASNGWWSGFKQRHPELLQRNSKVPTSSRNQARDFNNAKTWFDKFEGPHTEVGIRNEKILDHLGGTTEKGQLGATESRLSDKNPASRDPSEETKTNELMSKIAHLLRRLDEEDLASEACRAGPFPQIVNNGTITFNINISLNYPSNGEINHKDAEKFKQKLLHELSRQINGVLSPQMTAMPQNAPNA